MIVAVSAAVTAATLLMLLPLCTCKKKAMKKFTDESLQQKCDAKEKRMQRTEVKNTQGAVTVIKSNQKLQQKEMGISAENIKQSLNLETAKLNDAYSVEATQSSSELSDSQEVSSHGTLEYVKPRVRFFERAKEFEQSEPIDKHRNEYKTLLFLKGTENLITGNIYPREVRQQDITECKIEKYSLIGYQRPEIMEGSTCKNDDF